MTQPPEPPLAFCEFCGAPRRVVTENFCHTCGRKHHEAWELDPAAAAAAATAPQPYAALAPRRRRRGLVPILIGVGLVAVVALAGGFYVVSSSKPGASPASSNPAVAAVQSQAATSTPVAASIAPTAAPTITPSIDYTNPKSYRVVYAATVHNGNFGLNKLQVYMSRPIDWEAQKNVTVESVAPSLTSNSADPLYGNGIYYWEFRDGSPGPGQSLEFKIQFTFTASETRVTVDPDRIQAYDTADPLYKLYTRTERYVETTDPQITALADQIAAGETNPYRLANKFYDYVVATAHYQSVGKTGAGAKFLLTGGQGDCGDYSSLFVALARAKGIPARHVVGYWALSGLDQTHVWAEFYLQGLGWVPVDPTVGQSSPDTEKYFGYMDNQRVILNKGLNFPFVPAAPDNVLAAHLQTPTWWFWGSSGDSSSIGLDRTEWTVTPIG
jgi:transglutaminase-like putative cysteine protease